MAEPTVTVRKISGYVPTAVLGADGQGRTLVRCPSCGDTAHIAEDGHVVCPTGEAMSTFLASAVAQMRAAYDG